MNVRKSRRTVRRRRASHAEFEANRWDRWGARGVSHGSPVAAGRRLLVDLCLRPTVSRNVVAADLWPDQPEEVGRANLRRALWHVPAGSISALGTELVLQADTDISRARQLAARAISGELLTLDDITLLSSDILPGWNEEWLIAAQDAFAIAAGCRRWKQPAAR